MLLDGTGMIAQLQMCKKIYIRKSLWKELLKAPENKHISLKPVKMYCRPSMAIEQVSLCLRGATQSIQEACGFYLEILTLFKNLTLSHPRVPAMKCLTSKQPGSRGYGEGQGRSAAAWWPQHGGSGRWRHSPAPELPCCHRAERRGQRRACACLPGQTARQLKKCW